MFPARAGMVPWRVGILIPLLRVPRASGDGPGREPTDPAAPKCSPRERGWSPDLDVGDLPVGVFPARAGMVRSAWRISRNFRRVPRASGDGPSSASTVKVASLCSPRERGWSGRRLTTHTPDHVFPARAGMVPRRDRLDRRPARVPRASGDGPLGYDVNATNATCSPRERGWSRRDPPPRGLREVFPARAGMVPGRHRGLLRGGRVPRASGDGPVAIHHRGASGKVFPARAGMVR